MASLSIAFPIQPDRFDQARRWGREKMGPRYADFTESNRHVGLVRESWHLQQLPNGEAVVILTCEGPDLPAMFAAYAAADGRTSAGKGRRSRSSLAWISRNPCLGRRPRCWSTGTNRRRGHPWSA